MLIEVHMIKSFPPTNLNRDESGTPKTCSYGGVQRGRISSQCLKHAWRANCELFEDQEHQDRVYRGTRTRKMPEQVGKRLAELGVDPAYIKAVQPKLTGFGNKDAKESNDGQTSQIMFFAPEDIEAVAQVVKETLDACENPAEIKKMSAKMWQEKLKNVARPITLDMALFGRMVTDVAFKDVEACMQVAHAISTHAVNMETDFFTAVDDLKDVERGDDAGSAMMGDCDYNACCYYLYAALDTDQLRKNVEGSPEVQAVLSQLLPELIKTMAFTNPAGKQNSFAGHALPALVAVEKKTHKVPVSYAAAFDEPIFSREGYAKPSVEALADHANLVDKNYGVEVDRRLWFSPICDATPEKAEKMETLPLLLEQVGTWLTEE